ncbi:hypothetical protein AB8U03_00505 [Clostridium sp. Mt-5]|uniref:Uncharacterized protein n=1 Tax=Clostridium moutaii TaxID=3240932 RepID=A0ABV4BPJ9_9CLOT
MYRCPIMDSNEYIGEDDMYDWDVDYPMQDMYPPNMYRMCPMVLNNSNPCMNCMYQMDYMQSSPPTYPPPYSKPEEMTGYYKPYDDVDDLDLEEEESVNAEPEDENIDKKERFVDNSECGAKIRTVNMSEIED